MGASGFVANAGIKKTFIVAATALIAGKIAMINDWILHIVLLISLSLITLYQHWSITNQEADFLLRFKGK